MISVTIATFNRSHLLKKVLSALALQTIAKDQFEIIVCDSHSDDETSNVILEFLYKNSDIKLLHLHTINVLAAKRNLGIKNSSGSIVVFFDDDCIPNINCLEVYANSFEQYAPDNKVILCGEVRFPEEWIEKSNYYRFRDSRHYGSGRRNDLKELDYKTIVVMNMAFRKEQFVDSVKFVNEKFVGYGCEDQELGWRLENAGFKLKIVDAKITHYEESGTIYGYSKKIYHTAMGGSQTLRNECLAAYKGIKSNKLLDRNYPFISKVEAFKYSMLRLLISRKIASYLAKIVTKFDSYRFAYCPIVFRYILAASFISGVEDRKKTANKIDNCLNWYE